MNGAKKSAVGMSASMSVGTADDACARARHGTEDTGQTSIALRGARQGAKEDTPLDGVEKEGALTGAGAGPPG